MSYTNEKLIEELHKLSDEELLHSVVIYCAGDQKSYYLNDGYDTPMSYRALLDDMLYDIGLATAVRVDPIGPATVFDPVVGALRDVEGLARMPSLALILG